MANVQQDAFPESSCETGQTPQHASAWWSPVLKILHLKITQKIQRVVVTAEHKWMSRAHPQGYCGTNFHSKMDPALSMPVS